MDRIRASLICFALLAIPPVCLGVTTRPDINLQASAGPPTGEQTSQLRQLSLPQLQRQLSEVDDQLKLLAPYSLRSGVGVIGYRSDWRGASDRVEWIEIDLGEENPIDELILIPTIWRDTNKGFQSDGFPGSIRVIAGTEQDSQGSVIAEYGDDEQIEPRIGPLVVSFDRTDASWVRIEATRLSSRAFDGKKIFQLAEVLVFSGDKNVALRKTVSTASNSQDRAGAWDSRFLVDGLTPYLMNSSEGDQSQAYVSRFGEQPVLYIDLGSQYPISGIHLHAVDQDDTVPLAYAGDFGFPNRLKVEGSTREDFSDVSLMLDYNRKSTKDIGPIMMWQIPETTCRFIRFRAVQSNVVLKNVRDDIRIGFAEIELFCNGKNVAMGKRAFADYQPNPLDRSPDALTDGRNLFGGILPIRTWLNQLAKRHDLERMRPKLVAELNDRYAQQRAQLTLVTWLAGFLAVGIGATFLLDRIIRMRQLAEMRTRFAADLHDELSADLHVIALLSDLSRSAVNDTVKHESIQQRIRVMTQRSSDAVRYCTNMLEAKGLYGDLVEDMQRSTERIMADFEGDFSFEDNVAVLTTLKPRTRADLFLFYKECLVNISRHSNGSRFDARLTARGNQICLTVHDDGTGLPGERIDGVPPSLQRRAGLLAADVTVEQSSVAGTTITLKMKIKKWRLRR